jgi:hypothetical protein
LRPAIAESVNPYEPKRLSNFLVFSQVFN